MPYTNYNVRTTLAKPVSPERVAELKDGSFWLIRPEDQVRTRRWEQSDLVTVRFGMNGAATIDWVKEFGYPSRLFNHFKDDRIWGFYLGDSLPATLPDPLNPLPPPEPVFDPLDGPVRAWYAEQERAATEAKHAEIMARHGSGLYIFDGGDKLEMFVPFKNKSKRSRKPKNGEGVGNVSNLADKRRRLPT